MRHPKGLDETEHASESFQVRTTEGLWESSIDTDYLIRQVDDDYPVISVFGDDDFEDGPVKLRTFNVDYVIDYGWKE